MKRLAPFAVFLVGCAYVHTTESKTGKSLAIEYGRKVPQCDVEVYREMPSGGEEVASSLLEGGTWVRPDAAIERLRYEACRVEANALVIHDEKYSVPFVGTVVRASLIRRLD